MRSNLWRASAVVTALSLAAVAASFLLQLFLAGRFGAGAVTDAYLSAATLPTLVNTVFLTAMNITFIPVFIEYETRDGGDEAWRVANSFMVVVLAALLLLALAGSLGSAQLIGLIAPGLARDPATLALAAGLQRVQLPAMIFMAWGGLLAGLFYAQQSFLIPALAPLIANLVALLLAWLLNASLGIYGLALGVLVGNAVQVLFLLICLRARFGVRLRFAFGHPGVRQIGRLMLPWLLGAMIYKAHPVVERLVASHFPAGAISILGYAALLAQLAVFVSSKGASLAVFPAMSRLANAGQQDQFPALIDAGLRLVITAVVPITVLILILGETIVRVLLQRGAFSAADARLTSLALVAYSGSIVALAVGNVVSYVYYALQDTRTPAVVGSLGMALNLALALLLRSAVGFLSPAVSYSAMTLVNLAVLLFLLRRRLGRLVLPGFAAFIARAALAGVAMAIVVLLLWRVAPLSPGLSGSLPLVRLLAVSLAGCLGYLLCWLLVSPTLRGRALHHLAAYRLSP